MKIGIWGHYHGRNLGDDIVVATLLSNLRARIPEAEFSGLSIKPADTATRHGIPSYSILYAQKNPCLPRSNDDGSDLHSPKVGVGYNPPRVVQLTRRAVRRARRLVGWPVRLVRLWRIVHDLDAIIVAGSQPFTDEWGTWAHPFKLFKWSVMCRLTGCKLVLSSVGVGPIEHRLARWFCRVSLRTASYSSFRDRSSIEAVHGLGVGFDRGFVPDTAFAFDQRPALKSPPDSSVRPRVGISTMARNDSRYWPQADQSQYRAFLHTMVRFSRWLIDRGYDIVLLKSQTVADALVAEDLLRELHETAPAVDVGRIHNPSTSTRDELMAHIATCDLVVGVRFHCHVLPFVLGIPVVGIAYHDKSADLMDYMGQSEFSIPVSELSFDSLVDRFSALESKKDAIEDSIRRRSQVCRDLLYRHFDEIANAVVGKPVSKSN